MNESQHKIVELTTNINNLQTELYNEYLKYFSMDGDLKEAVDSLSCSSLLRMTPRGLVRYVEMDFTDFDDTASDALTDFLAEFNATPDFRLNILTTPVTDYILYQQGDDTDSVVVKQNGEEDINEGITSDDEDDRNQLLKQISENRNGLPVFVYNLDNTVEEIELEAV